MRFGTVQHSPYLAFGYFFHLHYTYSCHDMQGPLPRNMPLRMTKDMLRNMRPRC